MNFKKIAVSAAVAGTLLASALPAFAGGDWHRSNRGVSVEIKNDDTTVNNRVLTVSNTGLNEVNGGEGYSRYRRSVGSIKTGDAWASSDVYNQVNTSTVDLCGCLSDRRGGVKVKIKNDDTDVNNRVLTVSNTGLNVVNGRGSIDTGDAGAESVVANVVNTNMVN